VSEVVNSPCQLETFKTCHVAFNSIQGDSWTEKKTSSITIHTNHLFSKHQTPEHRSDNH
jgi:hypothetical protein